MTHALKATVFASSVIGALALVAVLSTPRVAATFPSGSPGGFAGNNLDVDSLGNNVVRTCNDRGCHQSFELNSGTGGVSLSVPSGVEPGETVAVTVTVDNTTPPADGSATGRRQGFEVAARDPGNVGAGTFTITDASTSRLLFGGDPGVTHSISGTTVSSWSFDWTAPAAPGPVTFYAAGNAANGDGFKAGDYIYTTTATVLVGGTAGAEAPRAEARLTLSAPHPNPVRTGRTAVRLTLPEAGPAVVRVVDGRGRTVRRVLDERLGDGARDVVIRTDDLAPGLYFIVAEAAGRTSVQPVSVVR